MANVDSILKEIDMKEVKELAREVSIGDMLKVLKTFDQDKLKDVMEDVDFRAALKAAKSGDPKALKKALKDIDMDEVKDLIDRNGDGDIQDDIDDIIKMIKD